MKNNSKSGLKIGQIVVTLSVLFIVATSTQLFIINEKNNNSKTKAKNIDLEEKSINRKIATTSRGGNYRESTKQIQETKNISEDVVKEESEKKKNFTAIEEIEISKDMDLTISTGISKEDFRKLMENLKRDTSGFFSENSDIIYDLCYEYQLNEIFFCGLIAGEAGWDISENHRNSCNYISMMSKGKLIKYKTTKEGLEAATKLLHNKYLSEGGAYYSGKTLEDIQKKFCPKSSTWVNLIYNCMQQIV